MMQQHKRKEKENRINCWAEFLRYVIIGIFGVWRRIVYQLKNKPFKISKLNQIRIIVIIVCLNLGGMQLEINIENCFKFSNFR